MEDEKLKATKKAMGLLQHMDRTEWELRSKLEQAGFSEEAVEAAIQYVAGYHYIDDKRYAKRFVEIYRESRSMRRIRQDLQKRHVPEQWITLAIEAVDEDDSPALQKALEKLLELLDALEEADTSRRAAQIDKDGNVVEEWVSSKEEHVIYGLPEGSYTLHEELAPYEDGYVSASDVMFEVKEDGSVTKVEMKDEYSKVEISKTDLTTGKELEGAKLQIIRKDGTVLEEWITDGKPHSVEKLPVNEELTLREITAPDGYEIAEDVTFTLKDTMEVQKVEMKDARTPEKTTEKTNAPKTGDNQKIWAFVLLALASAGTATGVTVYRRKKSKMTDNKKETEEK